MFDTLSIRRRSAQLSPPSVDTRNATESPGAGVGQPVLEAQLRPRGPR